MKGKGSFRIRLGRVELRKREVQEVLKELSKRIREALESAEGEMEAGKKRIVGEIRIAKKRRGKEDANKMKERLRGDNGL